ncbi:MAG: pantetheine-phosphate adenylyltransferase [Candidatus Curtissbacteria bacterium]|nr:pantetheine-phosphate adenylyltransferase [Candidatus Curtissbacteria bacterium]
MGYPFNHLALGGTFDYLHLGHKAFLDFAFSKAAAVSIGITTDKFISSEKLNVRPLKLRLAELNNYLRAKGFDKRSKTILLDDVFGSTVSDITIDGIAVTKLTQEGAALINKKRTRLGLASLKVLVFPIVMADDNKPISSSRISLGEIDRDGSGYFSKIGNKDYYLPENLRIELSVPHGELFGDIDDLKSRVLPSKVIAVGDETTFNFLKKGIVPRLSIVDLKVGRKKIFEDIADLGFSKNQKFEIIQNPASTIKRKLSRSIKENIANKNDGSVIEIIGEEDLAVLPATILAPLGWRIVYGQPNEGLVLITVTEETKTGFLKLLERFRSS